MTKHAERLAATIEHFLKEYTADLAAEAKLIILREGLTVWVKDDTHTLRVVVGEVEEGGIVE